MIDVRERQAFFAVQPHQFVVDADRRAARGQAQHAVASLGGALANQVGDLPGDRLIGLRRMRKHAHRNALALGKWISHLAARHEPWSAPFGSRSGCSIRVLMETGSVVARRFRNRTTSRRRSSRSQQLLNRNHKVPYVSEALSLSETRIRARSDAATCGRYPLAHIQH